MRKIKVALQTLIGRFLPIIKNTVFFDSFMGQYNDNPKYISEELHRTDPSINIIWSVSTKGHENPPKYAKTVRVGSREYYKYINRAAVVVDNHTGIKCFGFLAKKSRFLNWIIKNKKQFCISTWHGTPLKKIGKDTIHRKSEDFCSSTDYCVAGCTFTANALESAFYLKDKMRLYGTPRNDVFFNTNIDIGKLKEKLHLPQNKKVILFAPTFRDSVDMSGIEQLKMIDINKLLSTLEQKFGGEFVFVFRVHQKVIEKINNENILEKYGDKVIDGNLCDDMAEYLLCTDILLTDYSGSLFDFALTRRPCFLFMPDKEHYEKVERGFYIDTNQLPYPQSQTYNKFLDDIKNFDETEHKEKVSMFLNDLGNVEDGKASDRVVKDIISHIHNH